MFFFSSLKYFIVVGTQGYSSQFHLNFVFFREVDGQWIEEEKLEAHSDWVRDVAWAPNVGLPVSTFASCSQVKTVTFSTLEWAPNLG